MIDALFGLLPVWIALPLLLVLCALGLIVAAALFQASVMLAEAVWHGSLRMTNALTLAFARMGVLTFQWCGMAVLGIAQVLRALICAAWDQTARRLCAALLAPWQAVRQRMRLWDTWRREFRDEFETFDDFLYAFEHGGKRREQRDEPKFDAGAQSGRRDQGEAPKRPPPDPHKAAYAAACRLLGLPESGFTPEQLNARYRALMGAAHPDKGGDTQRAAAINAARDLIKHTKGWI